MTNTIETLPTPSVVIYEDVVKRNCKLMHDRAISLGVDIRPHMKTHKTIEIGKFQTETINIKKIIVSTLSEARFFALSGQFKDILYTVPIVPTKLAAAAHIHSSIDVLHLMVDHPDHIKAMVEYRNQHLGALGNKKWSVFLKIDCGYHRAGADPELPSTIKLVEQLTKSLSDHFVFQGIYTHSGHSYKQTSPDGIAKIATSEATVAGNFAKKIRSLGYPCPIVSIGSTPVCCHLPNNLKDLGVTEIHPGNYVFYDLMQVELGNCKVDDVGVHVVSRVISVYPERNEMLVDAGSLALSSDPGCTHLPDRAPGFGIIVGDNNLRIVGVTQEIGKVSSVNGSPIDFNKYTIGSIVRIVPNHSCLTAAMFSNFNVLSTESTTQVKETWIPNKHW
ncbi:hypothetical protein DFA_05726 [Cavenderia fasciculata]|uniref:D-serine dehydratase n=1 Tax=Cavenderia fasciculata TaxID=261658 RepID=F4PM92_CACFS|nr:uncharacterized protein DFA_05726 [Cavenderia fasciculata]EGG23592.1 hypothetical protein DFA_05726 [Cavenderia fasciculata]|eukprot:XP_004361443.1 hypothetical protein DFA_05726 [Cavenderia fasciculata]